MNLDTLILPITIGCAVTGTVVVLVGAYTRRKKTGPRPVRASKQAAVIEMECTECHRQLIMNSTQLQQLSPVEIGLAVRSIPSLVGQKLSEYVCPFCEASHCFAMGAKSPEWVGVNLYVAHKKSANCFECHIPLRKPAWPKGMYDDRVNEAPGVHPDHGMVCSRCHAVCCHGCCEETSHRRGEMTELYCPRCMRKGITAFYHP